MGCALCFNGKSEWGINFRRVPQIKSPTQPQLEILNGPLVEMEKLFMMWDLNVVDGCAYYKELTDTRMRTHICICVNRSFALY